MRSGTGNRERQDIGCHRGIRTAHQIFHGFPVPKDSVPGELVARRFSAFAAVQHSLRFAVEWVSALVETCCFT